MRCHSGDGRPTPATAAWTLAGSSSTNSSARQIPAAQRVRPSTRPTAPASSSTPVRYTMNSGNGTNGGTMATMSALVGMNVTPAGTKWALAVMTSMTASPWAALIRQVPNRATPSRPSSRNTSVATSRTIRVITTPLDSSTI
ncbi:hypothetical protein [Nonomuraea sp. NPDC050643]|uniref:hypothetical protein n=1 Tax=Nonomuraea sp. NPDC050643 TaxID=3155660 RepID=UPI0034017700